MPVSSLIWIRVSQSIVFIAVIEPSRETILDLFEPRALEDYVPPPDVDLGLADPVADGYGPRHLIGLMGPSRVALGSDYPFPLGESRPGGLIESLESLAAADRHLLLWGAAMQFLGRSPA